MAFFEYIAYYKFFLIEDPQSSFKTLRALLSTLSIKGTLLIAPEGINGMFAGPQHAIHQWITAQEKFFQQSIPIKTMPCKEIPFKKAKIKIKKELVPVGDSTLNPAVSTGKRLTPHELQKWITTHPDDFYLIDTRNAYEFQKGSFKGAIHLDLDHSRDFVQAYQKHFSHKEKKPIVMFCTGGIRCEKTTAALLKQGNLDVYQLEGGILHYFQECGQKHFEGSLFIFDERNSIQASELFQA